MTSHISHHSKSESYDSTRTRPLTYVSRPSTLAMNLALGTKAKLAITNSLGRLNQKLRISLFPSPGTYLGVIQNQSAWSASEHHVWVAVLMVGVALLYGSRMGLSLAVTEIARDRNLDNHLVGLLLGSFYWGYLFGPFLGHFLSDRHGGELVLWASAIVWSLGAYLAVKFGSLSTMVIFRVICGLTQGSYVPALLSIIVRRTPEVSRAFLFSIIVSTAHVGSALVAGIWFLFYLHDVIDDLLHPLLLILAIVGVAWAGLVKLLIFRSIKHHKTHYKLSENMWQGGTNGQRDRGKVGGRRERLKLEIQPLEVRKEVISVLPWRQVLKSLPVIVLFAAHSCSSMFVHVAMSWRPFNWTLYSTPHQHHHHHEKISVSQISSSSVARQQVCVSNTLPWVAMAISSCVVSWSCQWLISRNCSIRLIRRTLTSFSLGGSAVFLFMILLTAHAPFSVGLTCTVVVFVFYGLSTGGPFLNPLDLAPSNAAFLFSAMETVGAFASIIAVHSTDLAVTLSSGHGTPVLQYLPLGVLNLLALGLYLAYGSTSPLQWDAT